MSVQLQKATQYYHYRTVLAIFSPAPDQIRAQMWSNGVQGAAFTGTKTVFNQSTL